MSVRIWLLTLAVAVTSCARPETRLPFTGTLVGRVRFVRDAKPAPGDRRPFPVHVNADGTLPNVLIYIESGLDDRPYDVPRDPALLDQVGFQFVPRVLAVRAGQKLRIRSSDSTLHNVHCLPRKNAELNVSLQQGEEIEHVFRSAEVPIPVLCDIHPTMRASIGVFTHPFFAVTGQDGRFEIQGVPAGRYTIAAWDESLGTCTRSADVKSGETTELELRYE
jgi:hypothetical protein